MAPTIKQVYDKLYPATYSFRADDVGAEPSGWTSNNGATCTTTIAASQSSHNKVLKCVDGNAAATYQIYTTFSAQTTGTIELWFETSDNTKINYLLLYDAVPTLAIQVDLNAIAGVGDNTMYHYKIIFNTTTDTYDHYLNGVLIAAGVGFTNISAGIVKIVFTSDNASLVTNYFDAIGFSWDTSYAIGDNVHWRHYFDQDSDFESEDVGTTGTTIGWVTAATTGANTTATIIPSFDEHKKILDLYDNDGAAYVMTYNAFDTTHANGTIEFWAKWSAVTSAANSYIFIRSGVTDVIYLYVDNSLLKYDDGAAHDILAISAATWYHLKVDFECGAGGYRGLAADTFYITIDNVQYGPYNFKNVVDSISRLYFQSSTADSNYHAYYDAISYSWTASQYIADNRTLDYNSTYTKVDISDDVLLSPFTKDEYGWSIVQLQSKTSTTVFNTNSFIQIYDANSDLRFEGFYHGYDLDTLKYIFHDLNKTFLMAPVSYIASAAEDANATFLGICTNVGQASGRCIYYTEDDPTGNLTPAYRGTKPFRLVAAERAANASKILIIKPNGVCFLDDDALPANGAYTISSTTGEILATPQPTQAETQVNYVKVEGAIDPDTGSPFYGVSEDTSAQAGTVGIVRYYRRFYDLGSNADCAAKAAALRSNLNPLGIAGLELKGVYANPGELINFAYSPLSLTAANYFVETVTYNLLSGVCTYTLCDGLFSANDALMIQFSETGENHADVANIYNERYGAYYYSATTAAELQAYIDAIGTGYGMIRIQGTITLSVAIDIDGGGSYVIEGNGDISIIDCNGDRTAFEISSAKSCVLRNFKIDATDVTTAAKEIIDVTEAADNPIFIEGIHIVGNGKGRGIESNSTTVKIINCVVDNTYDGIFCNSSEAAVINCTVINCANYGIIATNGNDARILGNHVETNTSHGIYFTDANSIISGNIIKGNSGYGIYVGATGGSIIGNSILNNTTYGIYLTSAQSLAITGNFISNNDANAAGSTGGIYLTGSDFIVIGINYIGSHNNIGGGNAYPIVVADAVCDDTTIVGNVGRLNDQANPSDAGTNTSSTGNNWN